VADAVCESKSAKTSDGQDRTDVVPLTRNATAKGSGSRSRRQHESNANGSLFHRVPESDEIDYAWKETSFKYSDKKAQNRDLSKILHASKSDSEDTPKQEQRS
jgi:hypothetical protein